MDCVLRDIHTEAKETAFMNGTGYVFCDVKAEAEETLEHEVSLIVNLEYQQLGHTSQTTISQ
jgi:hypothetical protein